MGIALFILLSSVFYTNCQNQDRFPKKDTNSSISPTFGDDIANQTAAVGREAVLLCSVRQLGRFKVAWLRASDKMIVSINTKIVIQNDRISVKTEDKQQDNQPFSIWKLILRQLKETDRGCYVCQVNTSPMISKTGCLDVLVAPNIVNNETSSDLSVVEGENVTLTCKATGHPTPKISWKREDGLDIFIKSSPGSTPMQAKVHNGALLRLHRVDRKQMGNYLCIASNDVHPAMSKRISLMVNFLPNVQALNQLLGAPLGTDVILECYVEAYPNSVNYWIKNPSEMLLDSSKYTIDETKDDYRISMRLIVRGFQENDVGSYSCISSNSLGKVEGVSRLYRIGDFLPHSSTHDFNQGSILSHFTNGATGNILRKSILLHLYGLITFL